MNGRSRLIVRAALASLAIAFCVSVNTPAQAIECVPYARQVSGVAIMGDAWTWWGQARGAGYTTGGKPRSGAVMVFKRANGMRRGHVAVVREVVNAREVVIDHANWATRRSGRKGKIDRGVSVIDVSPRNDWSMVRVWYPLIDDYGTSAYPLYGFIYGGKGNPDIEMAAADMEVPEGRPAVTARPTAAGSRIVDTALPSRGEAPAGTLDAQLGATVHIRAGKPVVMGRPIYSAGDPGHVEVEPARRPTERADEPRSPSARPSRADIGNPVRHVAMKPGAGRTSVAEAQPPVLPSLKPAP